MIDTERASGYPRTQPAANPVRGRRGDAPRVHAVRVAPTRPRHHGLPGQQERYRDGEEGARQDNHEEAHRKEGIFEVKALHFEPGVVVDDALVVEVKAALQACAAWHKTPKVVVRDAPKRGLAKRLSDV